MDLRNKVAIVTGASRNIGKAIAEELLTQGAHVVVADSKTQLSLKTVNEFNTKYGLATAMYMFCNVAIEEDIKRVFKNTKDQYGHIDIVVNNVGFSDETKLREMVEVNLVGEIIGTYEAIHYMSRANGGRGGVVVNVSSLAGLTAVPFEYQYSATKAGIVGFTRSLGLDKEKTVNQGVRVTCLCPGFIETEKIRQVLDNSSLENRNKIVQETGIMPISKVVSAFMKLLNDPNNNGGVLPVSAKRETVYKYPIHLRPKL